MLNFWRNILTNNDKLSENLYSLLLYMHNRELCNSKWLECIKSILNETGLAYVWESQSVLNKTDIKYYIKQNLKDQFIQNGLVILIILPGVSFIHFSKILLVWKNI